MGKQNVPVKARRAQTSASSTSSHRPAAANSASNSDKKKKHGGVGAGNAFENLTYRSKHEVLQLGKPKGKLKRPAASQSHSLAQRQQSLLAEFGQREKANTFTDERIAETTEEMDLEDKLLLRFQKERQKRMQQSSKFALNEEDTIELTHGGQALSTAPSRKRYDDSDFDQENQMHETEAQQAAELERRDQLGESKMDESADGEEGSSRVKSRHEVMQEVMLKSKMFRAEKAVRAGEQEDLQGQLDAEFDTIRGKMEFVTQRERDAEKKAAKDAERAAALAAAKAKAKSNDEENETMEIDPADLLDPTDEFVLEARQLGLDIRAKATDRLKSDEELIAQEKKRLERLEKLRVKRMRGESTPGEDEEEEDEPGAKRRRREKSSSTTAAKKSARPTDDDLNENFVLTGSAVGAAKDENDLMSDDEEGNGDEQEEDDDDEEEDDEDESGEDDDDDDEDGGAGPAEMKDENEDDQPKAIFIGNNSKSTPATTKPADKSGPKEIFIGSNGKSSVSNALLAITEKLGSKTATTSAPTPTSSTGKPVTDTDTDLPFTFPAPTSYKEFRTILEPYPLDQHSVIIHRIKTCHHISLSPENRQKMEKFYAILLTHFRRIITEFEKRSINEKTDDEINKLIVRLDELGRHIVELTELPSMNAVVGRAFRAQLTKIRTEIEQPDATLHADQLLLLKFMTNIFPTSDFRHNVVTPSLLLMCEMLNRVPVLGISDMMRGFFIVSLLLHSVNASKRFVPEILTFLHATLVFGSGIQKSAEEKFKGPTNKTGSSTTAPTTPTTFSVQPTPTRLHASLQSRQMNFVPSPELAYWTALMKNEVKSTKGKKATQSTDDDLHIPLQYLFLANDAPVFTPVTATSRPTITSFSTLLQLVHQSAQLWLQLPSYPELFTPFLDAFGHVLDQQRSGSFTPLPAVLQQYTSHLHQYLSGSIQHAISLRTPLAASLAPLALKQHNPLFVEGYNPTKDYDPVKERAATKELAQKLKREKKGALRELRRDTQVVVQQQRQLQAAYAAERENKRKEAWQQMEEQQRDTNLLQKASKKKERKEQEKGKGKKR